jgi:hypothetical protein
MEDKAFLNAVKAKKVDPSDLESVFWFWLERVRSGDYTRRWETERDSFVPEKRTTVSVPIAGEMRSFSVAGQVDDLREWEKPTKPAPAKKKKKKKLAIPVRRGHHIEIGVDEVLISGYDTYYVRFRLFKLGLLWDKERLVWSCPIEDWEHVSEDVRQALEWAGRANQRKRKAVADKRDSGDWVE